MNTLSYIVVPSPSADFVRRDLDATETASCFLNPPVKKCWTADFLSIVIGWDSE